MDIVPLVEQLEASAKWGDDQISAAEQAAAVNEIVSRHGGSRFRLGELSNEELGRLLTAYEFVIEREEAPCVRVFYQRLLILAANGSVGKALDEFDTLLQLVGQEIQPKWLLTMGKIAAAHEDNDRFTRYLGTALQHPSLDARAAKRLGAVFSNAGLHSMAIEAYRLAQGGNNDDPELLLALASAFRLDGNFDAALLTLEGLRSHKLGWPALRDAAYEFLSLGSLGRASGCIQLALELRPADSRAHELAGDIYFAMRAWSESRNAYLRELELAPDSVRAWIRLNKVYWRLKDWDRALNAIRSASSLEPDNILVQHRLATTLDRMNLYRPPRYGPPGYTQGTLAYLRTQLQIRPVHVVSIGAGYDKYRDDDAVIEFLLSCPPRHRHHLHALLVEPDRERADELRELVAGFKEVEVLEDAVTSDGDSVQLFRTRPAIRPELRAKFGNDGSSYASTNRSLVLVRLMEQLQLTEEQAAGYIEACQVSASRLDDIVNNWRGGAAVDFLQIDVQGADIEILRASDLTRLCAKVLVYEVVHSSIQERAELHSCLAAAGYEIVRATSMDEAALLVVSDRQAMEADA